MTVELDSDLAAHAASAHDFLMRDEPRNGVVLGRLIQRTATPALASGEAAARVVDRRGETVLSGLLLRPPGGITLSVGDVESAGELGGALAASGAAFDTASGPTDLVAALVAALPRPGAGAWVAAAEMSLMQLTQVCQPWPCPGQRRRANAADLPLLTSWIRDFIIEALPHKPSPTDEPRALATRGIESGRVELWEVSGAPVATATWTRPTENGISINSVFTPQDKRGRGYASSLVAGMCTEALATGRRFVTLFADVTNPTSNKVYRGIGFRPIQHVTHWQLEQREAGP
jgi:hypothetical protein